MINRSAVFLISNFILMIFLNLMSPAPLHSYGESDSKPPDHLAWKLRKGFSSVDKPLFDATAILKEKEALKLSPDQEVKIENIMMNYQEFAIRKSAEIKIKELRVASYVRSDSLDKKDMATYIREISKLKTDWVVAYINYLLDLREVLTPQQLTTMKTIEDSKEKTRRTYNYRRYDSKGKKD